LFWLLSSI